MLARRNEEELAADMRQSTGRESVHCTDRSRNRLTRAKKEYRKINESYEKRLIFQAGFGAGLFPSWTA